VPFDLKPDMTVDETLQKIGWGCLMMLLRNERAAVANIPEGVHQMRVATRRLRSVVNAVKRMLPQEQYEWVSRQLKWLADILGSARNWDVFFSDILRRSGAHCSANRIWRVFAASPSGSASPRMERPMWRSGQCSTRLWC
jgi:inorganic triphosphatase YgiF